MTQTVRAIYRKGRLYPLEPLNLQEGQFVTLIIDQTDSIRLTRDEADAQLRAAGFNLEDDSTDETDTE